jgi:hypothetical protein
MKEKYIIAINAELEKGNLSLRNRIRRKGMPVEEWDEAQLKRLCAVCHISTLLSKEEEMAINAREAKIMKQRGIRHIVYHDHHKLDGEDIAMMASYVKGSNEGAHDGDYWDAIDAME